MSPAKWTTRLQTALVIVLFFGSLSILLFNVFSPLLLVRQTTEARERLRAASQRMTAAAPLADALAEEPMPPSQDLNQELTKITAQVLKDYPGVEGGFYLAGSDRFAGYAFPTRPHAEAPHRNEPPPLEAPYLHVQAQQSLGLDEGDFQVNVRDVGPSRVVLLTEPVGAQRPARMTTWLLFRLIGPEQLEGRLRRYALSSALALGGLVLSLALTWNLRRNLRRQRQEQERLQDALRRSEHLAALGRLLAGVAHEVRNPLAGIRSTIQLWQRLPDAAHTPESLEAIIAAVDRLNAIVSRLLYFSRADNAERHPVHLNEILNETLDLLAAQAKNQGIVLERDLATDLPPVVGSANALRQVVLNLLTNAFQAMPHGGRLRCSSRFRPQGRLAEVRVADTGPGVPEEVRAHLFEPFVTTRPDGTGLGLALCREIVQSHGGRIELETAGATGTTFLVLLPTETTP
jgi:two-component system, NtrC family, sensor histidine kinase HydH